MTSPSPDPSNSTAGAVVPRADYERLEREVAQLRANERNRADLVSRLSHDLRTPLSTIIGFSDLILTVDGRSLDPRTQEYLQTIQRNGQHLLEMLNEYLDLTVLEARRATLRRESTPLSAIIDDLKAVPLPNGTVVEWPSSDLQIRGDRRRITQAMTLLLLNAQRHSPRGGTITVSCSERQDGALLTVIDLGQLVHEQDAARIFQPYAQRTINGSRVEGVGLALAVARAVAEAHGGRAGVGPGPQDRGCAFSLFFPHHDAGVS